MALFKYLTTAIVIATFANVASAQWHSHDSRMYFDYGEPVMTSVIQSPDGRATDVRITTANSMFSFLRSKDTAKGAYYALRNVTIEAREQDNEQPLVTRNTVDTIYAKTFDESVSKSAWHAMSKRLLLPAFDSGKKYSLHIEIRDNIDRLVSRPLVVDLHTPQFTNSATSDGIAIGDITLADSLNGDVAFTSGRGNTYMFSRNIIGSVAFRLAGALGSEPIVDVSVRQISNLIDPADTGARFHGQLDAGDLHRASVFEFASADSIFHYKLVPSADSGTWTAIFNVPGLSFQQGKYEFSVRVRVGGVEKTQKNEFQLVWQGMPLSLEDPTDAIDPLAIIAQPEQINAINSGSTQEKRLKLYAYWKSQDPTPATAYNERMATFYQRVDYAAFNFTTGRTLNGAMTDRGKVYLLYGPPTKIERSFIPGDPPTEIWTYTNNVHRIFRFEEHGSAGEYQLANIQDTAASGTNN